MNNNINRISSIWIDQADNGWVLKVSGMGRGEREGKEQDIYLSKNILISNTTELLDKLRDFIKAQKV